MSIIHIAPDISYLFNPETAHVYCGRTAADVFASGEFIGVGDNLNPACAVCDDCRRTADASEEHGK